MVLAYHGQDIYNRWNFIPTYYYCGLLYMFSSISDMIVWYCNLLFFSWLYFHICLSFFHQMYTWYILLLTDVFFFDWNHRSCAKHVFCSRDWIVVSQNSVSEEQEATMVRRSKGNTEILFQKLPIPTYRANNVGLLTSEQLWHIPNSVWSRVSHWKWKPAHFVL